MTELKPEQLLRRAERLKLDAALDLTRLKKPMRRAVRLVVLYEYGLSEAAKTVKETRQEVYRAVKTARKMLAVIEQHVTGSPGG